MLLLSAMALAKFKACAFATVVLVVVITLTLLHLANGFSRVLSSPHVFGKHSNAGATQSISNGTLGFEQIFVLSLPERSDKRDSLSLAASLSGIHLNYLDGVRGTDVPNKALPVNQENRKLTEAQIGSWRSHMNAIRRVVEDNLSSVLILEDDVDWDIRLKDQLADFAKGSRYLLNITESARTHSPYGDGWDVLWVGLCRDGLAKDDSQLFIINEDPSVPNFANLRAKDEPHLKEHGEHSRLVHMAGGPICSFGYAVSNKGAQKLLYGLSVKELRGIFDNALSWWCTDHSQDAKCIVAQPTYFFHHRPAGKANKASDIQDYGDSIHEKGHTQNIRWSTKINLEKLILGRKDYEDSYPDDQVIAE